MEPALLAPRPAITSEGRPFHHSQLAEDKAGATAGVGGKQRKHSSKVIVAAVQACSLLRNSTDFERQMQHSRHLFPNQAQELLLAVDRGL